MATDTEHELNARLREHFGAEADWPELTLLIRPYLRLVVEALGPRDAVTFLSAARSALDEEGARAGTIQLGFAAYLWARLDSRAWGTSLAKTSAWEAALTMHRLAALAPGPGLGAHLDAALNACRGPRPAALSVRT